MSIPMDSDSTTRSIGNMGTTDMDDDRPASGTTVASSSSLPEHVSTADNTTAIINASTDNAMEPSANFTDTSVSEPKRPPKRMILTIKTSPTDQQQQQQKEATALVEEPTMKKTQSSRRRRKAKDIASSLEKAFVSSEEAVDVPAMAETDVLDASLLIFQRQRRLNQLVERQSHRRVLCRMHRFLTRHKDLAFVSKFRILMEKYQSKQQQQQSGEASFTAQERRLRAKYAQLESSFMARVQKTLKPRGKLLQELSQQRRQQMLKSLLGSSSANANATDSTAEGLLDGLENATEDDIRAAIWSSIVKKDIPIAAKTMFTSTSNRLANARRVATLCCKEAQKNLFKTMRVLQRETQTKSRRAVREMMSFWKRNEREERELRKRAVKEALERQKAEEEAREAKRQEKKLQFLITQTELYSHFIAHKSSSNTTTTASGSGKKMQVGTDFADVDDETLQAEAQRMAEQAVALERNKLAAFDAESNRHRVAANAPTVDSSASSSAVKSKNAAISESASTVKQPRMLTVNLKEYQLRGLTWLANLYDQGINGILADEMGLGKTIQSISLMAHLAESHNIWGPFLVVAPASTLHNWQQEISRFVPQLRAMPYWGNVNDRKTLRQFWKPKKLYSRDSPFHVLITSYQLVVSDEKHFQKIKWQYMILDEAQAIKSSSSVRWKTLLNFACRNRLLLTGTPIQNSMQELWALLHFIMPGLFDSHDEFSDWFSKDIESHVSSSSSGSSSSAAKASTSASGGGFNEHQLQRLHMILKPFMLRRTKAEVQHELGAKIEIDVDCDMSVKQRELYRAIREKMPIGSDLLQKASSDSLMNLVMQFRKVCNHPELFERTEIQSPFVCSNLQLQGRDLSNNGWWMGPASNAISYKVPKLISDMLFERSAHLDRLSLLCSISDPIMSSNAAGKRLLISDGSSADALSDSQLTLDESDSLLQIDRNGGPLQHLQRIGPLAISSASSCEIVPDYSDTNLGMQMPSASNSITAAPCPADIFVPEWTRIITDCGKMTALDALLKDLFAGGHRVLLYNQMTRMIDLMEEYLQHRNYKYIRLDGSSKIADRRDLVNDWQNDSSIFIFLLSTRAGGLGINLTAADTVIFYDSDWNPTVDQQAMDRAHRLGQTKQVTVYRLITRGSVEDRMRVRARQKDTIHRMVIAGGEFTQMDASAKPSQKEMLSLLMDDQEDS